MAIDAGSVYSKIILDASKFNQGLKDAEQKMNSFTSKLSKIGNNIGKVGKKLSKYITVPIAGGFATAIKSSIDFESAFAGVRKTVDATEPQFKKLEKGIRDMSKRMPESASEIAKVTESAGQLGIKTENILGFTETMVMLGDTTNLSSDQAATALARLANITGMPQTEFDRLGSTIVALGNNLATTESEIVEMGLRLAGTGHQVGMTEADILALAGAMSSVGINAEAGGSSMSRVIQKINTEVKSSGKNVAKFAEISGMSADEFSKAWEEKPTNALLAFVKGLDKVNKSGGDVTSILKELGINSIQEIDTMLRLSGANETLSEALGISADAWEENTALSKEAEQRYKTTESQLKILKNNLVDTAITIGDIFIPYIVKLSEKIKKLVEWFSNLNPETQETIVKIAGVAAAIGPLLVVGGKLISAVSVITSGLKFMGGALGLVGGKATLTAQAVSPLAKGIGGAGLAAKVSTALLNPWTFAIAAGGVAVYGLSKKLSEDAIPQVDLFGKEVSNSTKEAIGGFMELNNEATIQLDQLAWSGETITQKMADSLIGKYSEMNSQILSSMQERHTKEYTLTQELFAKNNALTEEERNNALIKLQEYQNQEQTKVQEGQTRIKEILNTASAEKRSLKASEASEINRIQDEMTKTAVRVMSESELEQKVIMQRLKDSAGNITAKQAAEVVKNSANQKEKTIKNAEEQFIRTKAQIEFLRDEAGVITDEQARELIRNAEMQKSESIKKATDMHTQVVSEAKKQSGEHVKEVNWETGEIKSKWQVMTTDIKDKAKGIADLVIKKAREQRKASNAETEKMRSKSIISWSDMSKTARSKFQDIHGSISSKISSARSSFASAVSSMESNSNSKFNNIAKKVSSAFGTIKTKIGEGISKIKEWNNTKVKDKVATFTQRVKTIGDKIISGLKVGKNATGTNYWRGGLTWVGEQGPELIELPRGSKVYSNQKSMDMVSGNNNISGNLKIEVPVRLDGRQIAKATVNFTAEELRNLQNRQLRGHA